MVDLRDCIPETRPFAGQKPAQAESRSSRVAHYVLPLWEVVSNRFNNVPIGPCDWLRIESSIPLIVVADGERIIGDPEIEPAATPTNSWALNLEPGAVGFDSTTEFRPGMNFTIEREIRNLSLFARIESSEVVDYSDPVVNDMDQLEIPGAVHLFVGSGAVRDVGPPLVIDHQVNHSQAFAAATSIRLEPIRPTIHGNNAASANGLRWIPSVVDIIGVDVSVTWAAGAGVITSVQIGQLTTPPAYRTIRSYGLNQTPPFFHEFNHPMRVENYTTRRGVFASDRGALVVLVGASALMTFAGVGLFCRSYM